MDMVSGRIRIQHDDLFKVYRDMLETLHTEK